MQRIYTIFFEFIMIFFSILHMPESILSQKSFWDEDEVHHCHDLAPSMSTVHHLFNLGTCCPLCLILVKNEHRLNGTWMCLLKLLD